jgi:hypothetical protein
MRTGAAPGKRLAVSSTARDLAGWIAAIYVATFLQRSGRETPRSPE